MEKKLVEFQAALVLASGTATSAPSRGFGAMNLGCAPQHENSKHRQAGLPVPQRQCLNLPKKADSSLHSE
jgi:hypothetical protein